MSNLYKLLDKKITNKQINKTNHKSFMKWQTDLTNITDSELILCFKDINEIYNILLRIIKTEINVNKFCKWTNHTKQNIQ